jgi:hypothetical protein
MFYVWSVMLGLLPSDKPAGIEGEAVVAYFIVLCRHLPGEFGRTTEFLQRGVRHFPITISMFSNLKNLKILGARRLQGSELRTEDRHISRHRK